MIRLNRIFTNWNFYMVVATSNFFPRMKTFIYFLHKMINYLFDQTIRFYFETIRKFFV